MLAPGLAKRTEPARGFGSLQSPTAHPVRDARSSARMRGWSGMTSRSVMRCATGAHRRTRGVHRRRPPQRQVLDTFGGREHRENVLLILLKFVVNLAVLVFVLPDFDERAQFLRGDAARLRFLENVVDALADIAA